MSTRAQPVGRNFKCFNNGDASCQFDWDRNGYCILYKRFHEAVFELPAPLEAVSGVSMRIDGQKLAALLAGQPKARRRKPKLRVVR